MPQYRFSEIKDRLDDWRVFNNMVDSPYYRDAVYEKFSAAEYERRYQALRSKMRERGLDCVIVPGGPNHWSFGGGMLWLSGHWEWHAMANYVVFPLEGEPTLIYSMGGTHIEATRRESAIKDVRQSRGGRFAEVMIERIKELGLERGKIGIWKSIRAFTITCRLISTTHCEKGCPMPVSVLKQNSCTSWSIRKAMKSLSAFAKRASCAKPQWKRWRRAANRA